LAASKDSFPEHAFFLETQNSVHVTRTVIVREDIQPQTVCANLVERQVDHLSQDGAAHALTGVRAQDAHKFQIPMR
jgi:hypothetical protein